jgi:hypothetical protein
VPALDLCTQLLHLSTLAINFLTLSMQLLDLASDRGALARNFFTLPLKLRLPARDRGALNVQLRLLELKLPALAFEIRPQTLKLIAIQTIPAIERGVQPFDLCAQQLDLPLKRLDRRPLGMHYLDQRTANFMGDRESLRCATVVLNLAHVGELKSHLLYCQAALHQIVDDSEQRNILRCVAPLMCIAKSCSDRARARTQEIRERDRPAPQDRRRNT